MKLAFEFERGGLVTASILLAEVPETAQAIRAAAPLSGMVYQARWSGKEVFVPVSLETKPPRENQTIRAALGDVIYFQEWQGSYQRTGFEAIGLFYGNEIVREWRGDAPVNVIGRIDPAQHALIQEIGERVWRKGGEKITIRVRD